MKNHTGILLTIGKGVTYTESCKHKLNLTSSMESALVAVEDAMVQFIWKRHFKKHKANIFLQNNPIQRQ